MSIPHRSTLPLNMVLAILLVPAASPDLAADEDRLCGPDLSAWREKTGAGRR